MAANASPFPNIPSSPGGPGAQPPPNAQGPPSGNPLLGPTQSVQPAGPSPAQRINAYMDQIRQLNIAIDALATQHPEAGEDLGQAKLALNNSMGKVASSLSAPEGAPQPQTF